MSNCTDQQPNNIEKVKNIIIDTDCGVDDALALMLAFTRTDLCKVLAITCCYGNTSIKNVCKNVLRVCEACNVKEVDIYRGCHCPLIGPHPNEDFFGRDGFSNKSSKFPKADIMIKNEHAANALVRLAKENPKDIILIAIGPLTNLAMAQRLDPLFLGNLKEVFILGGNTDALGNVTCAAEFNIHADPEAAHIVLSENYPFSIIPWETCLKHEMDKAWFNQWLKSNKHSKKGRMINEIMEILLKYADICRYKTIGDADLLAVAAAICPNSITDFVMKPVSVECHGKFTRGQLVVDKRPVALHKANSITNIKRIIKAFDQEILEQLRFNIGS